MTRVYMCSYVYEIWLNTGMFSISTTIYMYNIRFFSDLLKVFHFMKQSKNTLLTLFIIILKS